MTTGQTDAGAVVPSGTLLAADAEVARVVTDWRDRLLRRVHTAIDAHWLDKPTDDFSDEERGFERGLTIALREVVNLMHDKRHYL
jgi:hypothetical protein